MTKTNLQCVKDELNIILLCRDWNQADLCAEEYLSVLAECLADPHFIRDFHINTPIDQDLDTLHQKCPYQLYPFIFYSIVEIDYMWLTFYITVPTDNSHVKIL
jgi:hypothetical protein